MGVASRDRLVMTKYFPCESYLHQTMYEHVLTLEIKITDVLTQSKHFSTTTQSSTKVTYSHEPSEQSCQFPVVSFSLSLFNARPHQPDITSFPFHFLQIAHLYPFIEGEQQRKIFSNSFQDQLCPRKIHPSLILSRVYCYIGVHIHVYIFPYFI